MQLKLVSSSYFNETTIYNMLKEVSVSLFGSLVAPYEDYFDSLKETLRKARIPYTLCEYLSISVFVGLLSFVFSLVGLTIILSAMIPLFVYSFTLALIVSFVVGLIALFLSYSYPSLKAKGIKQKIDKSLPFSIFYMATTASSGSHPVNIFKMLSLRGGEIGEEANKIYTSVQTLGMDINTAIQRAASRTPSRTFSELLWGMVSVMTTGGNIESYLKSKTKTAMAQYRRALNDYAKTIALYTEIYITLIIVGTIFFIILIAIISPLVGGNTLTIQTFIVFFFIPLVSMGFIMLLKSVSPTE